MVVIWCVASEFVYFSKVLWENIIAIANEPGYENVCKYFQGASLEMEQVT